MAGRWERTESALEELGHLLGNMEPLKDQVRILLNNLDQEAFEVGVAWGIEQMKGGADAHPIAAAPELLEACEALLGELKSVLGLYDISKLAVVENAREAIAKAKLPQATEEGK